MGRKYLSPAPLVGPLLSRCYMRKFPIVFLFAAFAFTSVSTAGDIGYPLPRHGYKKLDIHYYFGYKTPTPISLDRARTFSRTEIISTDSTYISHFIRWLDFSQMVSQPSLNSENTNAFIVIDLYRQDDGKIETFYSDGDYLYSLNPSMKKPVDQAFRSKFYFGVTGEGDITDYSVP